MVYKFGYICKLQYMVNNTAKYSKNTIGNKTRQSRGELNIPMYLSKS